jgi:hypothetical protein
MKDDELLAKLSPEAIAILQAAITPRIETSDITISSIDDGVIVTTTAAGVYRQQGPRWSVALTELVEFAPTKRLRTRDGRKFAISVQQHQPSDLPVAITPRKNGEAACLFIDARSVRVSTSSNVGCLFGL